METYVVVEQRRDTVGNVVRDDWLGPYSPGVAREVVADLVREGHRAKVVKAPTCEIE